MRTIVHAELFAELTFHIKTLLQKRLKPETERALDVFRNFLNVMDPHDNSKDSLHASQTSIVAHYPLQSTGKMGSNYTYM